MSNHSYIQELASKGRKIGGLSPLYLLEKMRREGVAICGLGRANLPLLSFLPSLSVPILSVRDRNKPDAKTISRIREVGARPLFGEGYLRDIRAGVIFRTPSLRPDTAELVTARARGAVVLTEVALLLSLTPSEIFAVTGSDGKTTTAMMSAAILEKAGRRTLLGGNIGTPLLSELPTMRAGDALVLELSSFQLADLDAPCGSVAITNLTENHLDWHTDMAEYSAAKARILGGGRAVLPLDDPRLCSLGKGQSVTYFTAGSAAPDAPTVCLRGDAAVLCEPGGMCRPLFRRSALRLGGHHNLKNAMTAAALTCHTADPAEIACALSEFRGAPHRAAYLGHFGGVACYDSSIDTTPTRSAATLSAFPCRPVVLLGGRGKNLSPLPIAEALIRHAGGAVLTGEIAGELAAALDALDPLRRLPRGTVPDFRRAVLAALAMAKPHGTLLLSPAATSFDCFASYAERGDAFLSILREAEREGSFD